MAVTAAISNLGILISDAFDQFDVNKDQRLDEEEIFGMLSFLGFSPTADDVLDFIEETDLDADGRVSLKEFQRRLRMTYKSFRSIPSDQMLKRIDNTQIKDDLAIARKRRRDARARVQVQLDNLKREQLDFDFEDEEALAGSSTNPELGENFISYSFMTKTFPNRIQSVRGRGELIPDEIIGKSSANQRTLSDSDLPLRYFMRVDSGACLRLPVLHCYEDILGIYTVTMSMRISSLPFDRQVIFYASPSGYISVLNNGMMCVRLGERNVNFALSKDICISDVVCGECHSKIILSDYSEGNYISGWTCNICARSLKGERFFCKDCSYDVCKGCSQPAASIRQNLWSLVTFVVDCPQSVVKYYLNGTLVGEAEADDNLGLKVTRDSRALREMKSIEQVDQSGNKMHHSSKKSVSPIILHSDSDSDSINSDESKKDADRGYNKDVERKPAQVGEGVKMNSLTPNTKQSSLPSRKAEHWATCTILGDPIDKDLCQGGDLRFVRVDSYELSLDEVLTVHVPNGVWKCSERTCARRNSPSLSHCSACGREKRLSATAPPNDLDPSHPGLHIVVADTFERIVLDSNKHVFLDVTGDWCGPSR